VGLAPLEELVDRFLVGSGAHLFGDVHGDVAKGVRADELLADRPVVEVPQGAEAVADACGLAPLLHPLGIAQRLHPLDLGQVVVVAPGDEAVDDEAVVLQGARSWACGTQG